MEIGALLAGLNAETVSASLIVVIVVLMILSGKLVPERFYKRQEALADKWESAHNREVEMRNQLMKDMSTLIDQGEVQKKISNALIENIPTDDETEAIKPLPLDTEEEDEGGG